jgi:murein DD-endopeptidase MepM/ murein hydrolase activator NlpD
VTGSVGQTAPVSRVQTSQLPPPSAGRPATVASPAGTSGGGRGMASYQPGQSPDPTVTGTVQQQPSYSPPPQTNNQLPPPIAHAPAQRTASAPRSSPAPAASRPQTTPPSIHTVAPGETLIKISRMYNKTLVELARVNNIPPHTKVNIGDKIIIPGGARASAAPKKDAPKIAQAQPLSPKSKAQSQTAVKAAPKSAPKTVAQNESTERAAVVTQTADPAPEAPVRAANNAAASFRWPAKGRVIAGFGPRTNGQQNDGINLALPEGTPVKAAEDGVVAYAGNELKGYGNLVLVRHSNGYVTAYAHARELLVKRGDPIKRGQVIARSGQTGNVDAPQLHFEIRKGPTPLDPMPMLSGG